MDPIVDPDIQRQFDASLADYQARAGQVGKALEAEQQDIAARSAEADERFGNERGALRQEVLDKLTKPADGQRQRRAGWAPSEPAGGVDHRVMSFGSEPDREPEPAPPVRPAPRARRPRVEEDDDYSEQSWMRD